MIFFLNGCSSSGKTTLTKALQYLSPSPLLHIGIDSFFEMLPKHFVHHGKSASQGFQFITTHDEQGPLTDVKAGPIAKNLCKTMPEVASLLAKSFDLVIDEVLLEEEQLYDYAKALHDVDVCFVGVYCDLKEMVEREILRFDRIHGLARSQEKVVHQVERFYDVKVDTSKTSAFDNAATILKFVAENSCQSFKMIRNIEAAKQL